jgi:hypothetical protein
MPLPKTSEAFLDNDAPTRDQFLASLRSLEKVVHALQDPHAHVPLTKTEAAMILKVGPQLAGWTAENGRRVLRMSEIRPTIGYGRR